MKQSTKKEIWYYRILAIVVVLALLLTFHVYIASANEKMNNTIEVIDADSICKKIHINLNLIDKTCALAEIDVSGSIFYVNTDSLKKDLKYLISLSPDSKDVKDQTLFDDVFIFSNRFNKYEIFRDKKSIYFYLYRLVNEHDGPAKYLKMDLKSANELLKMLEH